jgi:hypothetical protein
MAVFEDLSGLCTTGMPKKPLHSVFGVIHCPSNLLSIFRRIPKEERLNRPPHRHARKVTSRRFMATSRGSNLENCGFT